MNKRTGSNVTILTCSVILTFLSGNAYSQNKAIDLPPDDCTATELQNDDSASMAIRLSCYNHKLDNLTGVLSGLINERKRLNDVIGTFEPNTQQTLVTENSLASEQQQTIQQLQVERAELRAQLHRLLSEKQPTQLDLETDERLFRNYSEAYAALSIENVELRKLLEEYQASATSSQATANALKGNNEQQSAQITKLSNDIENLKLTIADLSTRKKKLTNEFTRAESRIGLMKKQLLANAALIKLQRDDVGVLQQAQIDGVANLDTADQNLSRIKEQHAETVSNLIATKEKLYGQINALTEDNDQIRKQAKQASLNSMATLGARDKDISTLSNEAKDLNAAQKKVTAKLASKEQELSAANKAYSSEIANLNEKNNNLNDSNSDLTETLYTSNTAIEDLQNQLAENTEQLTLSIQKVAALETQLETEKNTTTELTQAKNAALDSNSDLTDQLQTRLTQVNALQIERDRLAVELNVARPEIVSLTNNVEAKDAQSIQMEQTIASLQSKIEQANTTNTDLQTKLTSSEENNSAANEKVKTLTAAVNSLESILNESMDSNKHIEASLADIKTSLDASQDRLDNKQSQLNKLMAEKSALIEAHNALANESEKLAANIEQSLKANGADSVLVTRLEDNSLVLKVDSSQLFRTGSSRLSNEGQDLLSSVGNAIGAMENRRIMIEGHSDNVPLGQKLSAIFKDNLGLSMARALSTAKFFTDSANIPANEMSISGAGATKPLASNDTSEGRQKNRRVEISLLPANSDPLASLK